MPGTSLSFGNTTLPLYGLTYRDNFAELVTNTLRMPGLNGGFDNYGAAAGLNEVGAVWVSFTLVATQRGEMQALRDAINALAWKGRDLLVKTLVDENDVTTQRACMAKVNNISMPEDIGGQTDLFQPVSIVFQVDTAAWIEARGGASLWGLFVWGSGTWGTSGVSQTVTGDDSINLAQSGNTWSFPRIRVLVGTGKSVTNPRFELTYLGTKVADFQYGGTLSAGDYLIIDASRLAVTVNGVAAYGDMTWTRVDGNQWMVLRPGTTVLDVTFDNPTDEATVDINYYDAWR